MAFYQSQQFIEYKAKSSGLITEYVNPEYTSKTCCRYNISLKIIEMHLNSYVRFVVLNLVPICMELETSSIELKAIDLS